MIRGFLKYLGIVGVSLFVLIVGLFIGLSLYDSPQYAWRILTMLESDTGDINRFPTRTINMGASVSELPKGNTHIPELVTYSYEGNPRTENLQELIARTDTAAFLVLRDDRIVMQVYHNSNYICPTHPSRSPSPFDSAMIGAAIQDGYIGSVDDLVVNYIPEIAGRGLDTLTIRNLLRMDTGIRYISADDRPFFFEPFSDDALTYYPPDLRNIALSVQSSGTPIGQAFHYNNFHPLLEGMIIERATGMLVAEYLQERIWKPMGPEFQASWSLDSETSGFEKMESGVNASRG